MVFSKCPELELFLRLKQWGSSVWMTPRGIVERKSFSIRFQKWPKTCMHINKQYRNPFPHHHQESLFHPYTHAYSTLWWSASYKDLPGIQHPFPCIKWQRSGGRVGRGRQCTFCFELCTCSEDSSKYLEMILIRVVIIQLSLSPPPPPLPLPPSLHPLSSSHPLGFFPHK